jgi:matrix metalloproteinase-14 (membrane-inserted)
LFLGELDDHTLEQMQLPRCGVKDKVGTGDNRAKRYALQGESPNLQMFTYCSIGKMPFTCLFDFGFEVHLFL